MMLKNADIIIPAYLTEKFLKKEDEASPPQKEMTKAAPENKAPSSIRHSDTRQEVL